jgi:hypothetical protein
MESPAKKVSKYPPAPDTPQNAKTKETNMTDQTHENRREDYPGGSYELFFYTPPRIASRSDALALLDELTGAEGVKDIDFALATLRDAIAREVV